MAIYTISFRNTDTGLAGTLTFPIFQKLSDGSAPTNPAPAFMEIGAGLYKFTYVAAEEVVFQVDGGASIPATNRFVSGVLSPVDTNLDTAVSSRAPAATAVSTVDLTPSRAARLDNLDATVSSRGDQVTATQLRRLMEGRWKIFTTGPDSNKLVLYSNDGSTVLQKWDLKDNLGSPTSVNIFERVPETPIP